MELVNLQQLVVSLGLGMLLGLQRERTERSIGGIRTIPVIALFGTICGWIGNLTGTWIVAAGLILWLWPAGPGQNVTPSRSPQTKASSSSPVPPGRITYCISGIA